LKTNNHPPTKKKKVKAKLDSVKSKQQNILDTDKKRKHKEIEKDTDTSSKKEPMVCKHNCKKKCNHKCKYCEWKWNDDNNTDVADYDEK